MFACLSAWVWSKLPCWEASGDVSYFEGTAIFLLDLFLFKKMSHVKHLSSPHPWWLCWFVPLVSIHSAGIHCLQSICQLLCSHCSSEVLSFLPFFPSPCISASRHFTNHRKIYSVFLNAVFIKRRRSCNVVIDGILSCCQAPAAVTSLCSQSPRLLADCWVNRIAVSYVLTPSLEESRSHP